MKKVKVDLKERSYDICINTDLSSLLNSLIQVLQGNRISVISDNIVFPLYGEIITDYLQRERFKVVNYVMPAGEKSKELSVVEDIYSFLQKERFDRSDAIIALGGGVVGDVAGFVASTYYRGISFIQMPTTLLSQVDSSVGGKVGVNHNRIKNVIGSFYQPEIVCIYPPFLKTLPERQIKNGLAEIVVHSIIASKDLFLYIKENIDRILQCDMEIMEYLIAENCRIKRDVVLQDEYDRGIRAILNFGHTIGHAIEACSNYELLHGEAVSIGIIGALKIAVSINMLLNDDFIRIKTLLERIGLPVKVKGITADDIYMKMLSDKKRKMESFQFILPSEIGKVNIVEFNRRDVLYSILKELIE